MNKSRMEAFGDGVIAVIITIMVLEIKPPHGTTLSDLRPLLPVFFSYVMSFVYVGIYWNNHHHLLHATQYVTGSILWANLHLLFWLSLTPFATDWMGENHFAPWTVALYGSVLLLAAIAYTILNKNAHCPPRKAFHAGRLSVATGKENSLLWSTWLRSYCLFKFHELPTRYMRSWPLCG
jgi:uncharacterized membrane protein